MSATRSSGLGDLETTMDIKTKMMDAFLEEIAKGMRSLVAELEDQQNDADDPVIKEIIGKSIETIKRQSVEMETRMRSNFHPN